MSGVEKLLLLLFWDGQKNVNLNLQENVKTSSSQTTHASPSSPPTSDFTQTEVGPGSFYPEVAEYIIMYAKTDVGIDIRKQFCFYLIGDQKTIAHIIHSYMTTHTDNIFN